MRLQEIVDQRVEENKMLWLAQGKREKTLDTARRALERGLAPDVVFRDYGASHRRGRGSAVAYEG